jgi:RNA polymerase sigma-70 factor (ECF subfamily)
MSQDDAFRDLIRRVRAGDARAAAELVRSYEPVIRLAVHVRLTDPGLRRLLDSVDICQSVLGSFFLRAASGQFELNEPDQLLKLLTTMARNKLISHARRQRAGCRDYRRAGPDLAGGEDLPDPGPGPDQVVADEELLHEFRGRLSADERQLAEQRARGRSWKEIAAAVGADANALRARLARAVERVLRQLGLEE